MTDPASWRLLPDLLTDAAARYGDRPALARAHDEEPITFTRLADLARRGAAELGRAGLPRGGRVLLVVERSPLWLPALFSIVGAGLVAVPVPEDVPPATIPSLAGPLGAVAVMGTTTDAVPLIGSGRLRLGAEALLDAPDRAATKSGGDHADAGDVALIALTSGSTCRPRGVELTHRSLLWNVGAVLARERANPGESMLSLLPPAHLFELVAGQLCPLACGVRIVYAPSLLPNRLLAALRDERIARAVVVPALLDILYREVVDLLVAADVVGPGVTSLSPAEIVAFLRAADDARLVERVRRGLRDRIGPTLRMLVSGGAAIDPAWSSLCAMMGIVLEIGYGLTEAGPVVALARAADCPAGSVGRPLPGVRVRIAADGEILLKSPGVMRGYHGDAAATDEALAAGWLHTGDIGRLDEHGHLFVDGRVKEAIVTAAGTTVHPEQIEPHYADSLFAELCVVPMSDPQGNDVPVLVVVTNDPDVTDEQVRSAFCRRRSAAPPACRVTHVRRVPGPLPRTATGKIRRREMADRLMHGSPT